MSIFKKLLPNYKGISVFSKRYWKMWYQRRKYGFDESETWSLDYSLSKLIIPRLKMFKKLSLTSGSLPGSLLIEEQNKSIAKGFKWNSRWSRLDNRIEEYNCWDRAHKKWEEILNDIEQVFEDIVLEEDDWDSWNNKYKEQVDEINNKLLKAETEEEKKQIWDSVKSGRQYNKNVVCVTEDVVYNIRKEGLELFAKYFNSLWW